MTVAMTLTRSRVQNTITRATKLHEKHGKGKVTLEEYIQARDNARKLAEQLGDKELIISALALA